MTEDYVLSAYIAPPGPNAFISMRHNHCVALWARSDEDVRLVRYWEFERLSGIKHHAMPLFSEAALRDLLNSLLADEGLSLADVSTLWGTPGMAGLESFPPGVDASVASFHALVHLWSGFLMDTDVFRDGTIVGLAMDGGPDFDLGLGSVEDFYVGGVSQRGEVTTLRPISSPAVLFKAGRHTLGYEPGSLMALASASTSTMDVDLDDLAGIAPQLTGPGQGRPATALVEGLTADAAAQLRAHPERLDDRFSFDDNVASAVGKVVQDVSERIAVANVEVLVAEAGIDTRDAHLALSGGFALNCPTNSLLMNRFGFRAMLAPPCANDGGQALGLGLLGFRQRGDLDTRSFRFTSPFHGRDRLGLDKALARWDPWVERVDEFDADTFVADLVAAPLAWVDGAAEIGPRALGHRSLLADPRSLDTRDRLNELKRRQWWRPVAPIVLEEAVADWFVGGRPSPYMLEVFPIRPELADRVPAVVHLDGTARVQTLDRAVDPRLAGAIDAFAAATGVPIVCNTSLNDKGEPIVDDATQALNFCIRRGVAVAYVDGHRVQLGDGRGAAPPDEPAPRDRARFRDQEVAEQAAWSFWADQGIGPDLLFAIGRSPDMRRLLGEADGARKVALAAKVAVQRHPQLEDGMRHAAKGRGRRSFTFDGVDFVDEAPFD